MSYSLSTLVTSRWCMSTGMAPTSLACTDAGSGGGLGVEEGELLLVAGVPLGVDARGAALPPQAAATAPAAAATEAPSRVRRVSTSATVRRWSSPGWGDHAWARG